MVEDHRQGLARDLVVQCFDNRQARVDLDVPSPSADLRRYQPELFGCSRGIGDAQRLEIESDAADPAAPQLVELPRSRPWVDEGDTSRLGSQLLDRIEGAFVV